MAKIIKGIKVGTTDITSTYVNGNEQNDTKQLEVVAVSFQDVSGVISTPNNTSYTGFAITPTPTVTVVLDGVVTTLDFGKDYTLSYSNNTNAGIATVTATGKGNYTGTLSTSWTITGATITVVANDQSYDYDGNLHGSAPTVTTVNNQTATIKYRTTSSGTYNLTTVPQIRNVSQSGTIYFQVTAPNHNTYEGSYLLEIGQKIATLSWGTTSWVYDGETHSTTCTVSNLVSGDTCTVTLSGNSITNIGTTTVTATALSNNNYKLPADSSVNMVISITAGMFVKISSEWKPVKRVYKKVSGEWKQQVFKDFNEIFHTNEMYLKKN